MRGRMEGDEKELLPRRQTNFFLFDHQRNFRMLHVRQLGRSGKPFYVRLISEFRSKLFRITFSALLIPE